DRDQRVNGFQTRLHRFFDAFARKDAWGFHIHALSLSALDRPLSIDGVAEAVDHAAEKAFTHGDFHDGARPLNGVALFDGFVLAENTRADIVGFDVQCHAADAARELDHLAGLHIIETVHPGDAVAHREHLPDFGYFCFLAEILDLLFENRRNFGRADFHELHQLASFIAFSRFFNLVRKDVSIIWLPTLTTRPPRSFGSTIAVILGVFPNF